MSRWCVCVGKNVTVCLSLCDILSLPLFLYFFPVIYVSISLSLSVSLSRSLSRSLSLSSLSPSLSVLDFSCSLTLSLTPSLSFSLFCTLSLSPSLIHFKYTRSSIQYSLDAPLIFITTPFVSSDSCFTCICPSCVWSLGINFKNLPTYCLLTQSCILRGNACQA